MTGKIHTLVFLGFTAMALPLSGCIIDNTSSPPVDCVSQRYATVAWDIVKNVNNVPLSCEQANASDVILYFGNYGPYRYPCTAYQGTTDAGLPVGNYLVSMQLLAPNGAVLSDTAIPSGPSTFQIFSCAPDDIPTVTFGVQ